ncbi:hypothetical protein GLO73106DRAFT_00021010 [Gloeocapsa sp. PCC 73106]|nr:hypothetical protein GLO73106DRAFT_00021010 [Gloeocapsa sp. PCC 73106]
MGIFAFLRLTSKTTEARKIFKPIPNLAHILIEPVPLLIDIKNDEKPQRHKGHKVFILVNYPYLI